MRITRKHIKPNLLALLEKYHCVKAFLSNANDVKNPWNINDFMDGEDTAYGQIGEAFEWKHTSEGFKYWYFINSQLPDEK